jgi:7-alpha-hydroxysteroid dehydrogenase
VILDRFLLTDKVAIVTAAGKGIGAASAIALAEAGADILVAGRTESNLRETAAKITSAGRRAEIAALDLSDPEVNGSLAGICMERFGRIDVVVNNLGGWLPRAILDVSFGHLERAFSFNVSTAHALLRTAVPSMLESGGGTIVNISSLTAAVGARGMVAYSTAKAALSHYTRSAAAELGPRVRVNAIQVGTIATDAIDIVIQDDGMRTQVESTTALKRIGDTEDIASTVLYLASPASSYVTGVVLPVDGGAKGLQLDLGLPDL